MKIFGFATYTRIAQIGWKEWVDEIIISRCLRGFQRYIAYYDTIAIAN